jgi:hypothetical protein
VIEHVNLLGGVLDRLDGFDEFLALESLHGFRDGGLMDVGALLDRLCPCSIGTAVFDLIVDHSFVIVESNNPSSTQSASLSIANAESQGREYALCSIILCAQSIADLSLHLHQAHQLCIHQALQQLQQSLCTIHHSHLEQFILAEDLGASFW